MNYLNKAYHYGWNQANSQGTSMKVVPFEPYIRVCTGQSSLSQADSVARSFLESCQNPQGDDLDDFMGQKVELAEDRTHLILEQICGGDRVKDFNLNSLYEDLLKIGKWRMERPISEYHMKDKTWTDLNKMELQIRDQIRREIKDAAKDLAFPHKDLRESLLDFKKQKTKAQMLDMDMESSGPAYTPGGEDYRSVY